MDYLGIPAERRVPGREGGGTDGHDSGELPQGSEKPWGATVRRYQFSGVDPNGVPQDGTRLATPAHLLIKVTPSKTHPDSISYVPKAFPLDMIQPGGKIYGGGESNLKLMSR